MLRLRRRRVEEAAPGQIVFALPRTQRNPRTAQYVAAGFPVLYVAWALVLAVAGQPLLGGLAAFVWLELGLVRWRLARVTGQVVADDEVAARVAPALRELCERTRQRPPMVVLRSDEVRAACVRRPRGRTVLVLSCPFARRIDDAALRALLAHEVIHLVHGDLGAARLRSLLAVVAGFLAAVPVAFASENGIGDVPIWSAALIAAMIAAAAALAPANRRREVRADLQGASLCGDPMALARALAEARAGSEATRRRLLSPVWRVVLAPLAWRLPSHPPMAQRIAMLERLAAAPVQPA